MTDLQEYLFTYGTLRKGESNPMQDHLERNAKWIGKALFRGKLYYANGHPAAISSANENDIIVGDLFEFDKKSGLLQELDRYEGFHPGRLDESLYIRKKRDVILKESEEPHKAWIYIYNQPVERAKLIASGDYVQFSKR